MALKDWSTTAASNLAVGGVSIAEGMSPAGVNNAIRAMMAELASVVGTGSSVYNIVDYGADPTGVADSTTYITAAVTAAIATHGIVYCPPGTYLYTAKFAEITNHIAFIGAGAELTKFVPDSSYTGFAIRVNDCWRNANGEDSAASTADAGTGKLGVTLGGFSIVGDRATAANGILLYDRNDTVRVLDVKLKYLNGHALYIGAGSNGLLRESSFYDVRIHGCGSSTEEAIYITTGASVGDGTNQVVFHHCSVQYCFGTHLRITSEQHAYQTRRIMFYGFMAHGQNAAATAPAKHIILIDGNVNGVYFHALQTNGSHNVGGTKYACLRLDNRTVGADTDYPVRVWVQAEARVCNGNVYDVQATAYSHIEGTVGASNGGGKDIEGYELIVATGAVLGGDFDYQVIGPALTSRSFSVDSTVATRWLDGAVGTSNYPIRITESGGLRLSTGGQAPALYYGTDATPEGTITANRGSIYVKTNPNSQRACDTVWVKTTGVDDTGWRKLQIVNYASSAQLADVTDVVNTASAEIGQMCWESTTKKPVWKSGTVAGDKWYYADGTEAHSPA